MGGTHHIMGERDKCIKTFSLKTGLGYGLDSTRSVMVLAAGFCEHGNVLPGYIEIPDKRLPAS